MSITIVSVVVQLLAIFLPIIGVKVGSEQLTVTAQTLVVVVSGIVIWVRRLQMGDVTLLGFRR